MKRSRAAIAKAERKLRGARPEARHWNDHFDHQIYDWSYVVPGDSIAHVQEFDPDLTEAMSRALEDVCRFFDVSGRRYVREAVARKIVDIAQDGERDACRLRDRTLREFGIKDASR